MVKSNRLDFKERFFLIAPSVENIFSLCNTISLVFGSEVDRIFNMFPSGRTTDICNSGEPEYLAVNS